jgi:hypothetical protein
MIVKQRPILMKPEMVRATLAGIKTVTRRTDLRWLKAEPGSLIWVKETWAVGAGYDGLPPSNIPSARGIKRHFLADGPKPTWAGRTRVSIHMPKAFTRLWLEVVSVREELVREITEDDARREGFTSEPQPGRLNGKPATMAFFDPMSWFVATWTGIHGSSGPSSWSSNPRVARIEFKRVDRPEATR